MAAIASSNTWTGASAKKTDLPAYSVARCELVNAGR